MKKLILILFVLFFATGYSQTNVLSGFWGIDFGSSVAQAKSILDSKKGSTYSNESTKDKLIYTGGTFAGEDISLILANFYKGKFYYGLVSINPSSESQLISTYEGLKESLSGKYFEPQNTVEKFDYPFERGDGHEITAIKSEKASFYSMWTFDNATILLIISKDAKIALFYTETATEKIIKEIEAGKNKNDL